MEKDDIEITDNEEAMILFKQRKWKTVPQIFDLEGSYVGGYQQLKSRFEWPDNPVEIRNF